MIVSTNSIRILVECEKRRCVAAATQHRNDTDQPLSSPRKLRIIFPAASRRRDNEQSLIPQVICANPVRSYRDLGSHPIFWRRFDAPYIARFSQSQTEQPRLLKFSERDTVHYPPGDIGF